MASTAGPIRPAERSGVLHPRNLDRFEACWIPPAPRAAAVVDTYWHVRWSLPDGERIDQRIIDLPAVTLSIEQGQVPAPLVVTGVQHSAWRRTIRGRGEVFAVRLRPAGLAVLSDIAPDTIAGKTVALTAALDAPLHALLRGVADADFPAARARAADEAISARAAQRPPSGSDLLAGDVVDLLRARLYCRTGEDLEAAVHVSGRTIQRALHQTLGHGPKWVSRRIRLQEVARLLAASPPTDLARLAADLGYTDQSHLTRDFRSVAGVTPDRYRRELARLTAG